MQQPTNYCLLQIVCPILVTLTLLVINLWLLAYLKRQLQLSKTLVASAALPPTTAAPDPPSQYLMPPKQSTTGNTTPTALTQPKPTRQDNLTRMLLGCVAVYIITQLPMVLLNTLDHLSNAPYCIFQLDQKAYWEPIILTLALVNYSANFFVYVGTSSKYRRVVNGIGRDVTHRYKVVHTPEQGPQNGEVSQKSRVSMTGSVSGIIGSSLPFSWNRTRPSF